MEGEFQDQGQLDQYLESVLRLASAVTWFHGPRPWRGFTHGPLTTAKCLSRVGCDRTKIMETEWRGEGGHRTGHLRRLGGRQARGQGKSTGGGRAGQPQK